MSDDKYQHGPPPTAEQQPSGVIISADTRRASRLPPGQSRTSKWPVLDASGTPQVDRQQWRLQVWGEVALPLELTWEAFCELPRVVVFADFHCVTRWSRLGNRWEGVSPRVLLSRAGVLPTARFVLLHGCDASWTTNVPLRELMAEDAVLADTHDGAPLSADHGGPVRAVIPRLYAWKSAKWLKGIELVAEDRPGYWERAGYHALGDPWVQDEQHPDGQRFQNPAEPPPGAVG
jgi:DMSO/TMAO reductase YedYZ molybdopterin-dependent catalytic subunit